MGFSRGCRTCLILGDAGWALRARTLASPALPDPPEHLCWLGPLPSLSLLHHAAGLMGSVLGGKNTLLVLLEAPNKPLGAGAWQFNLQKLFGSGSL